MKHLILRIINEIGGVYEHKLAAKIREYGEFSGFEQLITDGFIERFVKKEGFAIKGIRLTQSGRDELARLNSIPIVKPPPTAEQLRFQELKVKLQDNSITFEELKELLRFINFLKL